MPRQHILKAQRIPKNDILDNDHNFQEEKQHF